MTTPEIKDLIQPLEQYVTPDQKSELEKILSIGKKWKEEGEHKKKAFREKYERETFIQELLNYKENKKIRELENGYLNKSKFDVKSIISKILSIGSKNGLKAIGYEKMNLMERKKFEDMFIRDLILYNDYPHGEFKAIPSTESIEEFKDHGFKKFYVLALTDFEIGSDLFKNLLQTLLKTGGLNEGSTLYLQQNKIGDDGAKAIVETIERTDGIKIGSELNFGSNQIGDDGTKAIAKMLEKTVGLKEGSTLSLLNNQIGDSGAIAIAEALAKTGGLKAGSTLDLSFNVIGVPGAIAIAKMLEETGGLKIGSTLRLGGNSIFDEGVKIIVEAIEKTGGMKPGSTIKLGRNKMSEEGKLVLKKLQNNPKSRGINAQIDF